MHDPMTVAHEIRAPWFRHWPDGARYRPTLVTIWHVDPETDHSEDSCGWFRPHLTDRQRAWVARLRDGHGLVKPMAEYYGNEAAWTICAEVSFAFREENRLHRPWYRHPRWHVRHWRIVVDPLAHFQRWRKWRCEACGARFRWHEAPISTWDGDKVWHQSCYSSTLKVPDAA